MNIYINALDLTEPKRILLIYENDEIQLEQFIEIKHILEDKFPDSEFVFLNGAKAFAIKKDGPLYNIEVTDD